MGKKKSKIHWHNAAKDKLPNDKQEVMISVNGIYHTTVYEAPQNRFLKKANPAAFYCPAKEIIYWTELQEPGIGPAENTPA